MPGLIHDPDVYRSIRRRVESLRVDARRQWGKMTIDQMLWHVNVSMREAVGAYTPRIKELPVPKALLRWAVINLPWGRGARTRPDMYAVSTHDFEEQKAQCLSLIDRIVATPLSAEWPRSASTGKMTGKHWSQLTAKHLDHHLRQFGA
jgi:DinB superfamily